VDTPALENVREPAQIVRRIQQRYLRLRIQNNGRSPARSVSAQILKIAHTDESSRHTNFDTEVLDLKVSLYHGLQVAALPRGAFRFFDLVHVSERRDGIALDFDLAATPIRLTDLNLGRGLYEVTIFANADNADSITRTVRWKWNGTIEGLEIEG
jgi:hypothetical protein